MKIVLPDVIRSLILDYFYSHRVYILKGDLLRELVCHHFFREVRGFYELSYHITLSFHVDPPAIDAIGGDAPQE